MAGCKNKPGKVTENGIGRIISNKVNHMSEIVSVSGEQSVVSEKIRHQ